MSNKKLVLVILSLFSTAGVAVEQRTEMQFDALPESVRNTVSHQINQHKISKVEKVEEDGLVKFDIVITQKTANNKEIIETEMIVAPDGIIMTLAQDVPMTTVPFPIMHNVFQRYKDLKIDEVEINQNRYYLLTGQSEGRAVNLKIYDNGKVEELESATSDSPPKIAQEQEVNPVAPTEDGQNTGSPLLDENTVDEFDPFRSEPPNENTVDDFDPFRSEPPK